MKNKAIGCALIFATILTTSFRLKFEQRGGFRGSNNELRKVLEISITGNPLPKGLSVYTFDIYNNILYIINKHDLIQIDLKNGQISKNSEINNFLKNKIKPDDGVGRIIVTAKGYFLSCLNDLYFVDRSGNTNRIYNNGSLINDFNIEGNNIILASRDNHIKRITQKGLLLSSLPFELVDAEYILSSSGLCYSSAIQDYIYEFRSSINAKVDVSKFAPIYLTKEVEDPDIAFDSEKYFIGFSYSHRSKLFIISKSTVKNQVQKEINLGRSFFQQADLMDEGKPNFRVKICDGTNYLVTVLNNKLYVFTFSF